MPPLTSSHLFMAEHRGTAPSADANLFSADDIAAYMLIDSVAISAATSKAVSSVTSAAPDSSSISSASSRAVSAAAVGSIADSKAVSGSGTTSVADSKAISVSGNTSIADSKAVSVATYTVTPTVSGVLGFQQPSVGAAIRVLNGKVAERVSVKDFTGVVGNGINDDSAGINAACAYLKTVGGERLYFPPGTYKIGTRINLVGLANITFEGAGRGISVLKASGSRTSIFSTFAEPDTAQAWADPATAFVASNLTFRGLTFDMAYDTIVDGGVATPNYGTAPYQYGADNYQTPLVLLYAIGVVVTDCEFRNCWFNAVEIYSCNDVWIFGNLFRNVGDKTTYHGNYSAVGIDGYSHRIHVTDNHMSNVGFGVSINAIGPNGNPDLIVGSRDLFIDDNQISNALWVAVQADGDIRRLSISRNRGNAIAKSVVFVQHSKSATNNALGPKNVIVHDNQFDDVSTDGISLGWIDLTVGSFSVRGNRLANSLGASGNSRYGLVCRQLSETIATVSTPSSGGHVEGNDLRGSFANQYAYLLLADYLIAINNIAHDTSGSMSAAMSSTGSHSPAASGTLTIP